MKPTSDPPLLDQIETPDDLRVLAEADLPQLAEESRRYLIELVSGTGGHLAKSKKIK